MLSHFEMIGICGLHYHPSDSFLFHGFFSVIPSCFMAFFSDPYSPLNFQFFIYLVCVLFINPVIDLFYNCCGRIEQFTLVAVKFSVSFVVIRHT